MTFEELLARAAEPTLQDLVGRPGVRLLAALDPQLAQPERLRSVALGLKTPQELLLDHDSRAELLSLLPVGDAEALAASIGLDTDGDVFGALGSLKLRRNSKRAEDLLAFFGLTPLEEEIVPPPPAREGVDPTHALFSHQRVAAERVLQSLAEEPNRVLLHMPTGSGKTRTSMHVIARMMNESEPMLVVWLAHSEELCDQAVEEFQNAWSALGNRQVEVQRWWGSHELAEEPLRDGLLVAGLAKAYSAGQRSVEVIGEIAGRVKLVIIDEAHQAVARTYQQVLEMLTEAGEPSALLGLTATPGRTWNDINEDERLAEFFFQRKIPLEVPGYDSPITYLVDEGYLADTQFEELNYSGSVELSDADRAKLEEAFDIPPRILRALAEDEQRNLVIVERTEQMVRHHPRLLIFAATVDHARLLATVLRARGIDADAVTGETPSAERARLITEFRDEGEEPRVLVNYGVLTMGFDAPRTSGAIIARPTTSLVLYSQMVGRATRGVRAGGNKTAEVATVVDTELPGFKSLTEAFHNWEDVWRQNN